MTIRSLSGPGASTGSLGRPAGGGLPRPAAIGPQLPAASRAAVAAAGAVRRRQDIGPIPLDLRPGPRRSACTYPRSLAASVIPPGRRRCPGGRMAADGRRSGPGALAGFSRRGRGHRGLGGTAGRRAPGSRDPARSPDAAGDRGGPGHPARPAVATWPQPRLPRPLHRAVPDRARAWTSAATRYRPSAGEPERCHRRWEVMLAGPADAAIPLTAPHAVVSRWLDDPAQRPGGRPAAACRGPNTADQVKKWACGPPRAVPGRPLRGWHRAAGPAAR